jgi:thioredoxin reductase
MYDVVIVGAGPAGLSAALILGRCRRSVLVFDSGRPRNGPSQALHGFLTRDGIAPLQLRAIAREQLEAYSTVEVRDGEVVDAACVDGRFEVTSRTGERVQARKLLLATGVVDNLPGLEGFADLYGTSVFHCPYCDGFELRDEPMAVYGRGARGRGLALELTAWTRDIVLCTDGDTSLDDEDRGKLARNGIGVREEPIARLEGRDGILEAVVFASGDRLPRRALFFTTGQWQQSDLAERLGCELNDKGTVHTGRHETTHLRGLYVAGDASRAVQWVVVAAAEGAEAAFDINTDLTKEDLR